MNVAYCTLVPQSSPIGKLVQICRLVQSKMAGVKMYNFFTTMFNKMNAIIVV